METGARKDSRTSGRLGAPRRKTGLRQAGSLGWGLLCLPIEMTYTRQVTDRVRLVLQYKRYYFIAVQTSSNRWHR